MTKILSAWGQVMQKKVDCCKRWGAGQSASKNQREQGESGIKCIKAV